MTLHIIAGHGAGDPGATGFGFTEAERVRALAGELAKFNNVNVLDTSRDWYADSGILQLDIPKSDCLLELHLDSAASQGARGGHVIIKQGFTPDDYDNKLANYIASVFPGRSSIITPRNDLANPNRAAARGINYRLLECCFISNQADIMKFNNELAQIAHGIADCFIENPQPSPQPKPQPGSDTGTITAGAYRCNCDSLRVRNAPSLSGSTVASYTRGETVNLESTCYFRDGYVWGTYIGSSGNRRFIALGKQTGKPEADDYLIKC